MLIVLLSSVLVLRKHPGGKRPVCGAPSDLLKLIGPQNAILCPTWENENFPG
jgi:hypothetical protein